MRGDVRGAKLDCMVVGPSRFDAEPDEQIIAVFTSRRRGTLVNLIGSAVSSEAIMIGNAAFLLPLSGHRAAQWSAAMNHHFVHLELAPTRSRAHDSRMPREIV